MSFLPQTYLKWLTSHCRAERCRSITIKTNRMTNRHSGLSTWRYFSYQFFYGDCYLLLLCSKIDYPLLENRAGRCSKIEGVGTRKSCRYHRVRIFQVIHATNAPMKTSGLICPRHASMAQSTATPEAVQTPDPLRELIISLPCFHLKVPTILRAG